MRITNQLLCTNLQSYLIFRGLHLFLCSLLIHYKIIICEKIIECKHSSYSEKYQCMFIQILNHYWKSKSSTKYFERAFWSDFRSDS